MDCTSDLIRFVQVLVDLIREVRMRNAKVVPACLRLIGEVALPAHPAQFGLLRVAEPVERRPEVETVKSERTGERLDESRRLQPPAEALRELGESSLRHLDHHGDGESGLLGEGGALLFGRLAGAVLEPLAERLLLLAVGERERPGHNLEGARPLVAEFVSLLRRTTRDDDRIAQLVAADEASNGRNVESALLPGAVEIVHEDEPLLHVLLGRSLRPSPQKRRQI